jgi:hypothetical protein
MALILKSNPIGIDRPIQDLQSFIYNQLAFSNYDAYGRAYKNEKSTSKIPEIYISKGNYKEVYFNDKFDATSFFLASDETKCNQETYENNVEFIFQCKLNKLFPLVTHRADAELHNTIIQLLSANPYGFVLNSYITGIDNVYSGLDTSKIKYTDMSNFHVVKFSMILNFNSNCV